MIIPEESSLTRIGAFAFSQCSSLQSIVLPQSVSRIGHQAFHSCWKLKERQIDHHNGNDNDSDSHDHTIDNSDNEVIGNIANNNRDRSSESIETWLKHRYHNLPIHKACYYNTNRSNYDTASASTNDNHDNNNNNSSSSSSSSSLSLSSFESIIQNNIDTIQTKDALGMTPLHIYACNPTATYDFMRVLLSACPNAINEKDINGLSPLMLYFICKGILFPREYDDYGYDYSSQRKNNGNHDGGDGGNGDGDYYYYHYQSVNRRRRLVLPLLWNYFEDGLLTCDDLKIIFLFDSFSRKLIHNGNGSSTCTRDIDHEWSSMLSSSLIEKDVSSGMYPFMSAATISNCGLDVIYFLAMKCPHYLMKE